MKRIFSSVALIVICVYAANAQRFDSYLKHWPDSVERLYRNYMLGLKVVDDNGQEIRRSEPIFRSCCFKEGFDRAAVCIPLNAMDYGEKGGYEGGRVWVCVGYDLKPEFVFPKNTYSVFQIENGMFLYRDMPPHYGTVGLVNRDGDVIFAAPYESIYFEDGWIIGVKELANSNVTPGIREWSVEFLKESLDSSFTLILKTPQEESEGLWGETKALGEEDKKSFEQLMNENPFQRGLNHVVHRRIGEAEACFKDSQYSVNAEIALCAGLNLKELECWTKSWWTAVSSQPKTCVTTSL